MLRSTLLLLLILSLAACNSQRGPKQTLVFKATPLPGGNAADLDRSQDVVASRLHNADLSCRFQVEVSDPLRLEVSTYGATEADIEKIKEYVTAKATLEFAAMADTIQDFELVEAAKDLVGEIQIDGVVRGAWFSAPDWLVPDLPPEIRRLESSERIVERERKVDGKPQREWLIVHYDPNGRVTGELFQRADAKVDQKGNSTVSFDLSPEGAKRMHELTSRLIPVGMRYRQLAIIWNGAILSAPRVQSEISEHGEFTGDFEADGVKRMAALVRSGQLPCVLEFEKVKTEGK